MEYSMKEMTEISGVSGRTLRYYDEIGLLLPKKMNASGYRIYSEKEMNHLQQILLYKRMGLKLEAIKILLTSPDYDLTKGLEQHRRDLLLQQAELKQVIETVEKTLEGMKGKREMPNKEKFKGLREQQIRDNEEKYGEEIREKYGEEKILASNKKYLRLSEAEVAEMQETEQLLLEKLTVILKNPAIDGPLGAEIFALHKKWLHFSWPKYQREAHKGLGLMYIGDSRFTEYYDQKVGNGGAAILNKLIQFYA